MVSATRKPRSASRWRQSPTLPARVLLRSIFRGSTRYLTNAVEQLDDQRHERRRRDTVQRHSEAGEGSGDLILLKGASGCDAVARQAHRKTASVPFPNAR